MYKLIDSVGNFVGDQYRGVAKNFMGVIKNYRVIGNFRFPISLNLYSIFKLRNYDILHRKL